LDLGGCESEVAGGPAARGVGGRDPAAGERPAKPGEVCDCGRPAVVVYLTEAHGPVPYCGIPGRRQVSPDDDEPVSANCRGGRHSMLVHGAAPCIGCECWCHAGEALKTP